MFAKDKYKPNLFNQDSESDDDVAPATTFGTNKEFAKNFNKLRSKELLKKHQNESDSDSSSDDTDDSSDNDTINPKFDEAFYKALASIKKKDPTIYTDQVKFFDEFDAGTSTQAAAVSAGGGVSKKPMTVVDYERKILLEKGGIYEDSDDDENGGAEGRPQSPSYNQEQQNLRAEFKKVIDADDDDDDDEAAGDSDNAEWGGIFKRRDKSKADEAAEEEQYTKWLAGETAANIGANAEALKPLKEYWASPQLAKEEAFLRDYILNNGYTKKSDGQVPCYDDIVGNTPAVDDQLGKDEEALSDDEAELEKQAEFEHKYNFRFEEPDADFIKRYPRTIENSVRRTDDRRKEKRVEVKERKERDKVQKLRELEMLSAMKKREIDEKIAKLRIVTGDETLAFDDADLEGDFDPEEYDRKMQAVFNSEYYQVEEEGDEKPECPADMEDLQVEDWDNYDPEGEADGHCEDDDFNMDCDFDGESGEQKKAAFQASLIDSTRAGGKRKRKRKSKFMEALQSKKPVFDPADERSFGDYLDEYYQLDYEDVIDDVPCRFKYTETVPNDFGLTVEEILLAKNKELNQWASLKKATQIRPEHVERNEIGLFKQKGKNEALKRKILQSLYEVPSDEEDVSEIRKPEANPVKKTAPISVKTVDNFVMLRNADDDVPKVEVTKAKKIDGKFTANRAEKPAKNAPVTEAKTKTKPTPKSKSVKPVATKPVPKSSLKRGKPEATPTTSPAPKKAKLDATAESSASNEKETPATTPQKLSRSQTKKAIQAARASANPTKPAQRKAPAKGGATATSTSAISDERLRAFGINPKKFHNKQKYAKPTANAKNAGASSSVKKQTNNSQKQPKGNTSNAGKQKQAATPRTSKGGNREALERMKAKMFAAKKE